MVCQCTAACLAFEALDEISSQSQTGAISVLLKHMHVAWSTEICKHMYCAYAIGTIMMVARYLVASLQIIETGCMGITWLPVDITTTVRVKGYAI